MSRKLLAIGAHASQREGAVETDWLAAFARREEVFFPERLVPVGKRLERPESGPRQRVLQVVTVPTHRHSARLELRHGDDGYELAFQGGYRVEVRRRTRPDAAPLKVWPLPRDAEAAPHTYELLVDVRRDDGPVVELTVRRDGEVLGLAVDVAPPPLPLDVIYEAPRP